MSVMHGRFDEPESKGTHRLPVAHDVSVSLPLPLLDGLLAESGEARVPESSEDEGDDAEGNARTDTTSVGKRERLLGLGGRDLTVGSLV